jgi:hypothetical protein
MIGDIFSWIFSILTSWYVWLPLAAVLLFLAYRNRQRAKFAEDEEHALLILEIPRTNEKQELAAEQMFASLHGILRDKRELALSGGMQEHISFEVAAINKRIRFYVWVPKHLQNFVEGQIYAQYPTVQIHEADEDYTKRQLTQSVVHSTELVLTDNEVLPIKTFQNFEVDPLAAITATLAKLEDPAEEMWIQVMARPLADDWHRRSSRFVNNVRGGGLSAPEDLFGNAGRYLLQFLEALWRPPEGGVGSAPKELAERDKTRISEVEKKSTKLGYQVKIRLMYLGNNQATARSRLQAMVGTFKQFNSTNLNGFRVKQTTFDREMMQYYGARLFIDKGYILNIEELASVFHLPHTNVETPNIVWASSKTAEPPSELPVLTGVPEEDEQISAFGLTNFRGLNQQFGLLRGDRSRHVYIIGQTGTGKSGLLELFALSDVFHNEGYAVIDPHGDFAVDNMRFIPPHRINDVVYFNPADTAFPVGFNPMEVIDPALKSNISSEIIGVLKRIFGDSWGPRLEYILRYTILALLDYPGSTLIDVTRMLTDKKFREEVLSHCGDTVVLNFWRIEFASWNDKFATEAVAPILNKVGAFTANPIIRNIIGQPKSTFNIREIMDEGKILVVNLSKGLIGEDNAAILGAFMVTKIQLAAMSRSNIANIEDRRPFYLYVDEFQNFATDSFATILSEARKYGLNLTVANQYVSQMNDTVRDAVFGNVGTMISFRVSADDSPLLAKQFEPQFEPGDLLQMHNRHFIINMVIRGEKAPAFSATTLQLPSAQTDYSSHIIENTRRNFAVNRADIEDDIKARITPPAHLMSAKQGGGGQSKTHQPHNNAPKPKQEHPAAQPARPAERPTAEQAPKPSSKPPENIDGGEELRKKRTRSRGRGRNKPESANQTTPKPDGSKPKESAPKPHHSNTLSIPHRKEDHQKKHDEGVELRIRR